MLKSLCSVFLAKNGKKEKVSKKEKLGDVQIVKTAV